MANKNLDEMGKDELRNLSNHLGLDDIESELETDIHQNLNHPDQKNLGDNGLGKLRTKISICLYKARKLIDATSGLNKISEKTINQAIIKLGVELNDIEKFKDLIKKTKASIFLDEENKIQIKFDGVEKFKDVMFCIKTFLGFEGENFSAAKEMSRMLASAHHHRIVNDKHKTSSNQFYKPIDMVLGHSMGGAVAQVFVGQYLAEMNNLNPNGNVKAPSMILLDPQLPNNKQARIIRNLQSKYDYSNERGIAITLNDKNAPKKSLMAKMKSLKVPFILGYRHPGILRLKLNLDKDSRTKNPPFLGYHNNFYGDEFNAILNGFSNKKTSKIGLHFAEKIKLESIFQREKNSLNGIFNALNQANVWKDFINKEKPISFVSDNQLYQEQSKRTKALNTYLAIRMIASGLKTDNTWNDKNSVAWPEQLTKEEIQKRVDLLMNIDEETRPAIIEFLRKLPEDYLNQEVASALMALSPMIGVAKYSKFIQVNNKNGKAEIKNVQNVKLNEKELQILEKIIKFLNEFTVKISIVDSNQNSKIIEINSNDLLPMAKGENITDPTGKVNKIYFSRENALEAVNALENFYSEIQKITATFPRQ